MNTQNLLNEREERYGPFTTHAEITQALKRVMHDTKQWEKLEDYQKEGLEMIMHKVARALNGDPFYKDDYVDIAGYATLIANQLE